MKNNNHSFVLLAYKESKYLEDCIKSLKNQTINSNIVIATSTLNKYIKDLAKKYDIKIIENKEKKGIANDFNFALNCLDSELVTIAHQDDLYEKTYFENILNNYEKYPNSTILFTDYYEIRNNEKVYKNSNLLIKKFLLFPLRLKKISHFKFIKRCSLRFGNAICCPSITFCKKNINIKDLFISDFTSNMDWLAWEKLSRLDGNFVYINKPLMGHRVHEDSTTTKIINDNKCTLEDYEMFKLFWPKCIAKILSKIYRKSEKSNKIK